ncbi:hypothetical protein BJX96DRAFT_149024 [Aspergillus floccosus]
MAPRYALSESESEPDEPAVPTAPSDDALERALRDTVAKIYKSGKMDELTVKRVRLAAEKALDLEEGFFKSHGTWKAKSDEIIKDEVSVQDMATQNSGPEDDEEEKPASPPPKKAKIPKRTKQDSSAASRKRQKTSAPESADEDEHVSEETDEDVKKPAKKQKKRKTSPSESPKEQDTADSDAAEEAKAEPNAESESEMSVVLDEEPKPQKRQKSSEPSQKGKKKAPSKAKGKDADSDPNQAEIKRLQGWLLKCGIRKMWWRELAPYDTPKAKIKHLKDMLKEVGMEGRYSLEKARQIREERELKADLEMVQEGAKLWGKESADEDSDTGRPRRRLNRGRQALAFLESDGEETD